jgi:hypothetical protein
MAKFKYKSSKKPFDIVDENDVIIKSYVIDFENENVIKEIISKMQEMTDNKIDTQSLDGINEVKKLAKDIINTLLDNDFDFLFERFENNIFAIIELVKELTNELNKSIIDKSKKYV